MQRLYENHKVLTYPRTDSRYISTDIIPTIKEHNNANIIAFGARIVGSELAKDIVKAYLDAEFMGGRHQMRVDMISDLEA